MCYEKRLFRSWATKKAQSRDEHQAAIERAHSEPPGTAPQREEPRRREVERELEKEIV